MADLEVEIFTGHSSTSPTLGVDIDNYGLSAE
jgi:hypothetical protein